MLKATVFDATVPLTPMSTPSRPFPNAVGGGPKLNPAGARVPMPFPWIVAVPAETSTPSEPLAEMTFAAPPADPPIVLFPTEVPPLASRSPEAAKIPTSVLPKGLPPPAVTPM